jgi:hypothetical protein
MYNQKYLTYFGGGLLKFAVNKSLCAKAGFDAVIERSLTFFVNLTTKFDLLGAFLVMLPS